MRVRLEKREESPEAVCPLCRAGLEGALWTCDRCGTALHAECAAELPRCPTLGCAGRPPEGARAPDRAPPPPRRPFVAPGEVVATLAPPDRAAQARAVALVLLGLLVLCGGAISGGVALWGLAVRSRPAPAPFQRPTTVFEDATLRGAPAHSVRLERGAYWELRVDGHEQPLHDLDWLEYRGIAPLPGAEVDLLRFAHDHPTFGREVLVGVTRDGRVVRVRETLGSGEQAMHTTRPATEADPQRGPPDAPARAPAEWVALLRSDDPVTVLDALAWLDAHLDGMFVRDEARLSVARAHDAPEVQQALRELRDSPIPWIAEAARAVVQGWGR